MNKRCVLLATASICVFGCAQAGNQDVWTTKGQSSLGVKTDTPALHVNESLLTSDNPANPLELRKSAISILLQAADSSNPLMRANAIEALQRAPEQIEPVVQRGLGDENRAVRYASAMTVGKLKLTSLLALVDPLLHDESLSVQAAAMYALKRCGRVVDLNPLSKMLLSDDPEVKGNAAYVLGELGERSALIPLRHCAGRGLERATPIRRKVVDMQVAEAMVKLGSNRELHAIRAAMFTTIEEAELAALACQICGVLKDTAALSDLTNLVYRTGNAERPPEIRMAAALAASRIDPTRQLVEIPVSFTNHARPELRAQAAFTIGAMRPLGPHAAVATSHLSRLMADPVPLVQVAAAGGILQMQPEGDGPRLQ